MHQVCSMTHHRKELVLLYAVKFIIDLGIVTSFKRYLKVGGGQKAHNTEQILIMRGYGDDEEGISH